MNEHRTTTELRSGDTIVVGEDGEPVNVDQIAREQWKTADEPSLAVEPTLVLDAPLAGTGEGEQLPGATDADGEPAPPVSRGRDRPTR